MSNVIPLKAEFLTARQVLENVIKREDIEHVYIVVVSDKGKFGSYASGDLSHFSDAALLMTDIAKELVIEKQEGLDDDQ